MYKKAVYKQYTDLSFTVEVPKPPWLGFLGPVIRAEVGDEIVVHLKNFASRNYSIHPHGVFYTKDSEGTTSSHPGFPGAQGYKKRTPLFISINVIIEII